MKVYVYPADVYGCGFYRLIWPARVLINQGHDVVIVLPAQRHGIFAETNTITGDLKNVTVPADADVMVIQRPTQRNLPAMVKMLTDNGIAVVVDIDDDLSRIDAQHPAFSSLHPQNGGQTGHSWMNVLRCCDIASLVMVSTDALAQRYARHGRVSVLRNCVPEAYLDIPRIDSDVIGWGGSVQSHPNDMQVMGPALLRLVRENGAEFKIVGSEFRVSEVTGLGADEFTYTGMVGLDLWPHRVSEIGVGVTPLADTQFNAAKSWLKPLEMAALGVPCVMSPRVEYMRIHKLGVGVLARKPTQWVSHLRSLIGDEKLRSELSERGRDAVRDLTYEKQAWRWMEAWTSALRFTRRTALGSLGNR